MRNNYWNAITLALGACAMPNLIAQVNLDPSRPIASAVLAGNPNPATFDKIGNLNWETSQATTQANLKGITEFSGNPHVQELISIFDKARAEYIKLDGDLGSARAELDTKQATYNSDPSQANAQALEAAVKIESDINKKMDAQNQILSAVAPIVTIGQTETIAKDGQRPLVLGQNMGVVERATEKAQNEPSYQAISGAVKQYNSGIKGDANLESIVSSIRNAPPSGQRDGDKNSDGFIDNSQTAVTAAATAYKGAPEDVSKLINYAQSVQQMFGEYAPVTKEFKANVLGEVLNGSWERNAINDIAGKGGIIESEKQARTTADVELTGKIEGVDGRLTTEVNGLKATDVELTGKIEGVDGRLTTEVNGLKATDVELTGKITAVDGRLTKETSDRITGDAATLLDAKQYTDTGVKAAKQYAEEGDKQTLAVSRAFTQDQVAAESQTRAIAVQGLDDKIRDEATARIAAIQQEAKERIAAIQREENTRLADIKRIDDKFTAEVDGLGRRIFRVEERVTAAEQILANHETRLVSAEQNIEQLQRGVAMTAALQTPVIDHGSNNAMKFSMANYGGENGFSFGYARRLFKGFSVDVEAASTSQFEEAVVRSGINFSW
jgi:hypothetical protein